MSKKREFVVFLDRDGTINVEKNYVHKIEDFEFIPGVIGALKILMNYGCKLYIVTNQSGIARGYYSIDDYKKVTQFMLEELQKEGIYFEEILYCPHHPEGIVKELSISCECRKPGAKLLKEVLKKYEDPKVFLFGDKNSDILAGQKVGAMTFLLKTGHGKNEALTSTASYIYSDLYNAVHSDYFIKALQS